MRRLLDFKRMNEKLPLGRTSLYEFIRQRCRHVRIGNRIFVYEDDFEAAIEKHMQEGETPSPTKGARKNGAEDHSPVESS